MLSLGKHKKIPSNIIASLKLHYQVRKAGAWSRRISKACHTDNIDIKQWTIRCSSSQESLERFVFLRPRDIDGYRTYASSIVVFNRESTLGWFRYQRYNPQNKRMVSGSQGEIIAHSYHIVCTYSKQIEYSFDKFILTATFWNDIDLEDPSSSKRCDFKPLQGLDTVIGPSLLLQGSLGTYGSVHSARVFCQIVLHVWLQTPQPSHSHVHNAIKMAIPEC